MALSFRQTRSRLLSTAPDIELWNASVQGDEEAFGILFRRHYSLLYSYGNKICQDVAVVEDSIQELFAELWQKKPEQAIQSVKAYLMQALKYKLYRSFRDKKAITAIEGKEGDHFELSHETFLIREQDDQQKIRQILEAINQLPPRQKEIVYLKIYKGLSYEEVSEIMGINYQVVRNLLCQALKTFRKLIVPIAILLGSLNS